MTKEEYELKKKKLEYIEVLTGISMDFQRGLLDYEASSNKKLLIFGEKSDFYSQYHAGLRYAEVQQEKQLKLKLTSDEHKN